MVVRTIGPGVLRCALAFLVVLGLVPVANAAFIVTINGNTIPDNGAGDSDPATGFITWTTTIDGYQIRLTSSTDDSRPTADLTTSQLRIVNTAAAGTVTGPLLVTISESFNAPPGYIGPQDMLNTLTRNIVADLRPGDGFIPRRQGRGGGEGQDQRPNHATNRRFGMSFGSFNRPGFYLSPSRLISLASGATADDHRQQLLVIPG